MMNLKNTACLEKLLDKHREKEKKSFLTWETLRTALGTPGRKLFGLTATATLPELKIAIEPFLGEQLLFSEHFGQWYFSARMPLQVLQAEIASEKTRFLHDLLAKEKKSYKPLKKATELKGFGLKTTPAPSVSELEKNLAPFLGSGLMFLKKKPATKAAREVLYLAYKKTPEEFVQEALQTQIPKKPFALKTIAGDVPLSQAEFVDVFNRLLESGQFQVTKIDAKFTITGIKPAFVQPPTGQSDGELFRKAFEKLDRGISGVRICNMRRELGWSEDRFNALLRKLGADGTIQLLAGDVPSMTEEDVHLSYMDENNFFYATLIWRKR